MGVYIKGMEMPSCCMFCPLSNSGGCGLLNPPIVMTTKEMLSGRTDWCPLVPVPPHGRLIDADALGIRAAEKQAYEAYLREKSEFFIEEPLREYLRGRSEGLIHASGLVRFAPTIISAEKEVI